MTAETWVGKVRRNPNATGTSLGIGAILLAVGWTVVEMDSWAMALTPASVGELFIQVGLTTGAYFSGKMVPPR